MEELDYRELRLERHAIMSDQYPIPMILNFCDKHTATTGMCNE